MGKFNEVLRPRPGLLVIRQTRFEPTLKTLAGLGILGIGAFNGLFTVLIFWGLYFFGGF